MTVVPKLRAVRELSEIYWGLFTKDVLNSGGSECSIQNLKENFHFHIRQKSGGGGQGLP